MMTKSDSHPSNCFRKILVPVDTNKPELSSKLVKHGLKMACIENQTSKTEKSTVIILNVIEDVKQGGAIGLQAKYGNIQLLDSFMSTREETATRWMSHVQGKDFEGADLKSEIILAQGRSLATVIVDYVSQKSIDLVVIGAGDLFKMRYLVVGGSVAGKVIKKSKCPVLLVR